MKAMRLFAASLFAAAILLAGQSCCRQDGKILPLEVRGTQLTAGGKPVSFHGMSFGWHNLWPRFYEPGTVKRLHDEWGANIFRAAIGADDLHELLNGTTEHPGYISAPDSALNCLYRVVDGAIQAGCYVIVDWHSHVIHTEEAVQFFKAVAERYAGVPNVIYELFNEPVSRAFESEHSYADLGDPDAMAAYWQDLRAYASTLIDVISAANGDYKPLILMGCPCWDQRIDLPAAFPIQGYDNLMYTVHFYAATHKQGLRDASDAALAAGIPLFLSECAACEASGDGEMDLESWAEWTDWADANGITMLTWSISDKMETCSMFTSDASSEGPWDDDVVKPWGKIVKDWIEQ